MVIPNRVWVHEGEVTLFSAKKQKSFTRYLFLFNDLLVITEFVPPSQYRFLKTKSINELSLKSSNDVTSFEITYGTTIKQRSYTVSCSSHTDTLQWIAMLARYIEKAKSPNDGKKSRKFFIFINLNYLFICNHSTSIKIG